MLGAAAQPPTKPLTRVFEHGGDAYMRVNFASRSASTTSKASPEGERTTEVSHHDWEVDGLLEVKTVASAPGERTFLVMGVVGSLQGRLAESHAIRRSKLYGEGGLHDYEASARETFQAAGVALPSFPGLLVVDIDARTWKSEHLASAFDLWPLAMRAHESYVGVTESPELARTGYDATQPYGDLWGNSALRPSATSAGSLGLLDKLRQPQPLTAMDKPGDGPVPLAGSVTATRGRVTATISWSIQRDLPELELRVTSPQLADWLPHGKRLPPVQARLPGPRLEVRAEVVDPTGREIKDVRIKRMLFTLEDTSRLPGMCMNWPYGSEDTSPDLELDSPLATDEGQRLEFTIVTTMRKTAYVAPYDFGGFATLRVIADLDDGRTLRGKLVGQTDDPTAIRIPARAPNSKVADAFKRQLGIDKADDDDSERQPEGATDGDGLTLFEEYRGFYIANQYRRADPTIKDVFVFDRVDNADTRAATTLFTRACGALVARLEQNAGEIDRTRIVNRNRGGPSLGAQHALTIEPSMATRPHATGNRPGRGEAIATLPSRFAEFAPSLRGRHDLHLRAIAQAMLGVCGVEPPGLLDNGLEQITVTRDTEGKAVATWRDNRRIRLRDERTDADLAEQWLAEAERHRAIIQRRLRGARGADEALAKATARVTRTLFVGRRGGPHSGPLGNIMRDTFADACWVPDTGILYVLSGGPNQGVGYELSSTSQGDGFNAGGKRFGDSPRPPSRKTFAVSDHR